MLARRREIVAQYQRAFADVAGVRCVADPSFGQSNFQSFWIELDDRFPLDRESLLEHLANHNISARRGIMAAHHQPPYRHNVGHPLPNTDQLTNRSLILPVYHQMTEAEIRHVINAVRAAAGQAAA